MSNNTLVDLVKGIRQNKGREAEYISSSLATIKTDLNGSDVALKAAALRKLSYLTMHGYDMDMALASIVEVMASAKFVVRRSAYLAASLAFQKDTALALLTINIFKKDMKSGNQYEAGTALSCLGSICTQDMAASLVDDLFLLLSSSKPYVRKKVALVLFRMFEAYPPTLIAGFAKLKDLLSDQDQSVLTAVTHTFLEISFHNPKNVLPVLPAMFHLLVNLTNNWMLIKLLKIFQQISRCEPRIANKLAPHLLNLLQSTKAKSVELEILRTYAFLQNRCGQFGEENLRAEVFSHIRSFLICTDKNLKALALEILGIFPQSDISSPEEQISGFFDRKDLGGLEAVLACVEDADSTIRRAALKCLAPVVTKENFQQVAASLNNFAKNTSTTKFAVDYFSAIVALGGGRNFQAIDDFAWYFLMLLDIARSTNDKSLTSCISSQISQLSSKVPEVRSFAFTVCTELAASDDFLSLPDDFCVGILNVLADLASTEWNKMSVDPKSILKNSSCLFSRIKNLDTAVVVLWSMAMFVSSGFQTFPGANGLILQFDSMLSEIEAKPSMSLSAVATLLRSSLFISDKNHIEGLPSNLQPVLALQFLEAARREPPVGRIVVPRPVELDQAFFVLPEELDFTRRRARPAKKFQFIDESKVESSTEVRTDFLDAFRARLPKNVNYNVQAKA